MVELSFDSFLKIGLTASIFYMSTVLKFLNDTIKDVKQTLLFVHKKVDDHVNNYEIHHQNV